MKLKMLLAALAVMGLQATVSADSLVDPEFVVIRVAEISVPALPEGELYWHVERFGSLDEAEAAKAEFSLATEFDSEAWLFTLADRHASGMGGTQVASIGPVPRFDAPEYFLQIASAKAPVGSRTIIQSRLRPEALLILSGRLTQRTPHGWQVLKPGGTMPTVPDQPIEVLSTGDEELRVLRMLIVDSARPFASPAKLR